MKTANYVKNKRIIQKMKDSNPCISLVVAFESIETGPEREANLPKWGL